MKSLNVFIVLFFCILIRCYSQSFKFVHGETMEPIHGVEILGMDSKLYAVSNDSGIVDLQIIPVHKVLAKHPFFLAQVLYVPQLMVEELIKLKVSPKVLEDVSVQGFDSNKKLLETSASIGTVSSRDIQRFSESSLVPAINNIAGIRMEERSPGSVRLSVRGSLLRSPFGVRNVKVYWNGIPFTEPGGNTPFNLLDVSNMARLEVLKGPASSIYGSGTGGVINISSFSNYAENYAEAGFTAGSFGLRRYVGALRYNDEKQDIVFNYSNMASDGYRNHSALNRQTLSLNGRFHISEKRKLSANLFYSDLAYQIPGGITRDEFLENPRKARDRSAEQNSSINLSSIMVGVAQDYSFNQSFSNVSSFYVTNSFFDHPFITDYKRDIQNGLGGRTKFSYKNDKSKLPHRVDLGAEFQQLKIVARNFENEGGKSSFLNFDDEISTSQTLLFAQVETDLPFNIFFTSGISLNRLNYDIFRVHDNSINNSYQFLRQVPLVAAPRLGLTKRFENNFAVYGSISKGFSPPTVQEIRTNEGGINEDLESERGFNYELGFRGNTFYSMLNFDMVLFHMDLRETIVSRTDNSMVTLFYNSGATSQRGLELSGDLFLIDDPMKHISRLKLSSSFTLYDFKFKNYITESGDFSGNALTGIPKEVFTASLDLESKVGVYVNINYNFTDRIPLNDSNEVFSDAYNLVILKMGYQILLKKMHFNMFAGVDNLLNETYSLGNDLNAFLGRYFQAAPSRNYFAGVKIKYLFKS